MKVYLVYNLKYYEDRDVAHVCSNYNDALKKEYEIYCQHFLGYSQDKINTEYLCGRDVKRMYLDYDYFVSKFNHDIEEWEVEQ